MYKKGNITHKNNLDMQITIKNTNRHSNSVKWQLLTTLDDAFTNTVLQLILIIIIFIIITDN